MQVEKGDTLGQILLDSGYGYKQSQFWGENGLVANIAKIANPEIPSPGRIRAGGSFVIPGPQNALTPARTSGDSPPP